MPQTKIKFKLQQCLSKEDLSQLTCIVPISVGQQYHEGEAFEETMRSIAATFGHVVIVVADSLQRWAMAIPHEGVDSESLRDEANRKGSEWLDRNKKAISLLENKLVGILRWDDIMKHPATAAKYKDLASLYFSGEQIAMQPKKEGECLTFFYEKVESTVKSTYGRQHRTTATFDPKSRSAIFTREYILEESAVFCMFSNIGDLLNDQRLHGLKGDCLAYPAKLNQAMYWLLEGINRGKTFRILSPIEILIEDPPKTVKYIAPIPIITKNIAPSFFKPDQSEPTDSVVEVKQEDVIMLGEHLSDFLSETSRLNGKLHKFQELFIQMTKQQHIGKSQYLEIFQLCETLTRAMSKLKTSTPQPDLSPEVGGTSEPVMPCAM